MKLILYHGTSKANAKRIEREGFVAGKSYNWKVKSKAGFVYLSSAYAPFFAMFCDKKGEELALIKVEVDSKDVYPDDDFIMLAVGKPVYEQEDLNSVNPEKYKRFWKRSLARMGNVAVKPDKVKILGVTYFDGTNLIMKCDPVMSPLNFRIMGDYYKKLSDWIYEGKDFMDFPSFMGV